jgi:hypothetical protein
VRTNRIGADDHDAVIEAGNLAGLASKSRRKESNGCFDMY